MSNHYLFLDQEENRQKLLAIFKGFGIQYKTTEDREYEATVHFYWQWNDQYYIRLWWGRTYHEDTEDHEDASISYWDGEETLIEIATKLNTRSKKHLSEEILVELSILFVATKKKVRRQLYKQLSDTFPMDIEEVAYTQLIEVFIEEYIPVFLTQTKLVENSETETLTIWFAIWAQYQYPNLYKGQLIYLPTDAALPPFNKLLSYLPKFILRYPFYYEPQLIKHYFSGKSIRSLPPYHLLTNKMVHWLVNLELPDNSRCLFTWAYLLGITDNDNRNLCAVAYQFLPITQGWSKEKFELLEIYKPYLLKLHQWFPKHTPDWEPVKEIFAYLNHCKQEGITFSLKGRTRASVQRIVATWQTEMKVLEENETLDIHWKGATYETWERIVGKDTYQIIQLTSTKALREEGLNMHHCVGSYGFYCKNGNISIWSLRQKQEASWKSLVTIEINSQQHVVQARGKYNSIPHPYQLLMIKEWAAREQLHWAVVTH